MHLAEWRCVPRGNSIQSRKIDVYHRHSLAASLAFVGNVDYRLIDRCRCEPACEHAALAQLLGETTSCWVRPVTSADVQHWALLHMHASERVKEWRVNEKARATVSEARRAGEWASGQVETVNFSKNFGFYCLTRSTTRRERLLWTYFLSCFVYKSRFAPKIKCFAFD